MKNGIGRTHDTGTPRGDRLWPTLVVAGLLLVVAVNFTYIWIAVNGADEVVPSYMEEER